MKPINEIFFGIKTVSFQEILLTFLYLLDESVKTFPFSMNECLAISSIGNEDFIIYYTTQALHTFPLAQGYYITEMFLPQT